MPFVAHVVLLCSLVSMITDVLVWILSPPFHSTSQSTPVLLPLNPNYHSTRTPSFACLQLRLGYLPTFLTPLQPRRKPTLVRFSSPQCCLVPLFQSSHHCFCSNSQSKSAQCTQTVLVSGPCSAPSPCSLTHAPEKRCY